MICQAPKPTGTGRESMPGDNALIAKAQAGCSDSMAELLTRHHAFIRMMVARGLGARANREMVDDYMTFGVEIMIRAVRNFSPAHKCNLLTYAGLGIRRRVWCAQDKDHIIRHKLNDLSAPRARRVHISHAERSTLTSPTAGLEREEQDEELRWALSVLEPRTRRVLLDRANRRTLHAISVDLNLCKERVRQIEAEGMHDLAVLLGRDPTMVVSLGKQVKVDKEKWMATA